MAVPKRNISAIEPLPMSRTRRKKYLPIQISIEAGYIPVVISL